MRNLDVDLLLLNLKPMEMGVSVGEEERWWRNGKLPLRGASLSFECRKRSGMMCAKLCAEVFSEGM